MNVLEVVVFHKDRYNQPLEGGGFFSGSMGMAGSPSAMGTALKDGAGGRQYPGSWAPIGSGFEDSKLANYSKSIGGDKTYALSKQASYAKPVAGTIHARDPGMSAPYVDPEDPYMGWSRSDAGDWLPPGYMTPWYLGQPPPNPPWAQGMDANAVRASMNANTPEGVAPLGDAWYANEWEGFANQQEAEDRKNNAVTGLNDTATWISELLGGYAQRSEEQYNQFINDPARRSVIENLMMRSDQDYSIYSDTERNALFNKVGQSIAQQRAVEEASNANRGISASGYSVQRDQDLIARGNADRLQIEANLAQGDEAAQQSAIRDLYGASVGFRQSDINAFGMSADIAGRLAGYKAGLGLGAANIEAGYAEQPTDLLAGPMLDMALSELTRFRDKAEAEGNFDVMDLITAVMDLIQVQPLEEVMKFLAGVLK